MSKVGQLMPNSWSTSSQPDFVHTLGRTKTARNRQGKILHTELLKSWPTLGQTPRQLPTPWEVAGVFLAVVLWQHPNPYPQNTRNSDHGLSFPSPETQTMV